ncbi:flavin reductase family protein [Bosea thiooxidans]
MGVDLQDGFKQSMRRLASTISIITATSDDVPYGMVATAVASVSASPAAIAIGVNRAASIHAAIEQSGHFCANLLKPSHRELVDAFSNSSLKSQRFQCGAWQHGPCRLPYLRDAQASLFCQLDGKLDYKTHSLFVGKIIEIEYEEEVSPLIWQNGNFGVVIGLEMQISEPSSYAAQR